MAIKPQRGVAQFEPSVYTLGIDIGYGVTKAYDGPQSIKFPSVWGPRRALKFQESEIQARYPGDMIQDEDGDWFVGDLAASQLPTGAQRRLRGRTASDAAISNAARVRLAKVALGKLLPNVAEGSVVQIRVATGLPVDHMRGSADLKAALLGTHRILTDRVDFVADIIEVMVMPQPYGTIYANTLLPDGALNPHHVARRTGVCDIGTYTIDVALDDDGEFIDAGSGSVEAGMYMAQDLIATTYEQEYSEKPSFKVISEAMEKGVIRVRGEQINVGDELNTAIDPVRQAAVELMTDKWGTGVSLDTIFCSGGGAQAAFGTISAMFEHAVLMPNAQMANAMGYRNYALKRERDRVGK